MGLFINNVHFKHGSGIRLNQEPSKIVKYSHRLYGSSHILCLYSGVWKFSHNGNWFDSIGHFVSWSDIWLEKTAFKYHADNKGIKIMTKSIWLGAALAFPIIYLSSWSWYVYEGIKEAPEITIRAEGYDPRNLISGHYLYLRLNWQDTDCTQFNDNLCHPNRFESIYKYYIPEDAAPKLDAAVRKEGTKVDLVFAYPENKSPYLKKMLINGIKWKKWLKAQKE